MDSSIEDQGDSSSPFMTMDMSMMFLEIGKVTLNIEIKRRTASQPYSTPV
jgi:hypothetical protein